MSLSIGIIGLPNVGKSTLFNALLKRQAALAANYPFATIEPNIGIVEVPDQRVVNLHELAKSDLGKAPEEIVPAVVKFVDIAGLVKGAAQGEGLGNKFLSHIREVDAIIHLLRFFEDKNVARAGSTSSQVDKEIINTELILADLEILEKRISKAERSARTGDKKDILKYETYRKLLKFLNEGVLASDLELSEDEQEIAEDLNLLTLKPVLYVFNVSEEIVLEGMKKHTNIDFTQGVPICAKLESELAGLSEKERIKYIKELGINQSGLNKIIREGYELLNLQTFFTYNSKEIHAWTIERGSTAFKAAGKIHSDFQRGFIRAEVIPYDVLVKVGGRKNARDKGLVRSEGKDYIMQEGDVVEFKFSV